jgi:hypothetical protein
MSDQHQVFAQTLYGRRELGRREAEALCESGVAQRLEFIAADVAVRKQGKGNEAACRLRTVASISTDVLCAPKG